ncbi:MAG: hypothetical protein JXA43_03320 [Candidatus Diapherotrites archaeon]|nr:hypothetical protein [Candidatus Diapherotrites archaeon]
MTEGIPEKYQPIFDKLPEDLKKNILALPVSQRSKAMDQVIEVIKKKQAEMKAKQDEAKKETAKKEAVKNLATKTAEVKSKPAAPKKVVKKKAAAPKKASKSDKSAADSIILLVFLLSVVWSLMAVVNAAFRSNIQLATIVLVLSGTYLFFKEKAK